MKNKSLTLGFLLMAVVLMAASGGYAWPHGWPIGKSEAEPAEGASGIGGLLSQVKQPPPKAVDPKAKPPALAPCTQSVSFDLGPGFDREDLRFSMQTSGDLTVRVEWTGTAPTLSVYVDYAEGVKAWKWGPKVLMKGSPLEERTGRPRSPAEPSPPRRPPTREELQQRLRERRPGGHQVKEGASPIVLTLKAGTGSVHLQIVNQAGEAKGKVSVTSTGIATAMRGKEVWRGVDPPSPMAATLVPLFMHYLERHLAGNIPAQDGKEQKFRAAMTPKSREGFQRALKRYKAIPVERKAQFFNPAVFQADVAKPLSPARVKPGRWDRRVTAPLTAKTVVEIDQAILACPQPPAAPTRLKAQRAPGPTEDKESILLSWNDNSINEKKFQIERRPKVPATASFSIIASDWPANTPFLSDVIPLNSSRCYRVRAINRFGNSAYSNEVCTSQEPPVAPGSLVAEEVPADPIKKPPRPRMIRLTWADNAWNENGFEVRVGWGETPPVLAKPGKNATTVDLVPPSKDQIYCFSVVGFNAAGRGKASNRACIAIQSYEYQVAFVKLKLVRESDWDGWSDSDEPYVILTPVAVDVGAKKVRVKSSRWPPQEISMDSGGIARVTPPMYLAGDPAPVKIYPGVPISITVMEHDDGDPASAMETIYDGIKATLEVGEAATAIAAAMAGGPVSAAVVAVGETLWALGNFLYDFWAADDHVGTRKFWVDEGEAEGRTELKKAALLDPLRIDGGDEGVYDLHLCVIRKGASLTDIGRECGK